MKITLITQRTLTKKDLISYLSEMVNSQGWPASVIRRASLYGSADYTTPDATTQIIITEN